MSTDTLARLVPADLSLAELAAGANANHELVLTNLTNAFDRAVECGRLLLEAARRIPSGDWMGWCSTNLAMSHSNATKYMRVAEYAHVLLADPTAPRTVHGALRHLRMLDLDRSARGSDALAELGKAGRLSGDDLAVARAMRSNGVALEAIAATLGTSRHIVRVSIDQEYAQRRKKQLRAARRKRAAQRAALAARERDDEVRRHGGDISHAYASLRRLASQIDSVLARSETGQSHHHLKIALMRVHQAEDELVRAIRAGRAS